MRASVNRWSESALAIGSMGLLLVAARALRLEEWVQAALWTFLSIWSVRVGAGLSRVSGYRSDRNAGHIFAAGGACLVLSFARRWPEPVEIAMAATALVLVLASLVVGITGRRRADARTEE